MARGNKDLQTQEIEALLEDLGGELQARGLTSIRVMVLGGAYMLLSVGNRASTQDIDFFPINFVDTSRPDRTTKTIQSAINAVAKKHGLKRDWMNDAAFGILGGIQPPFEQLILWKEYGGLEVYFPPAEFILAVKVFGFRDRDFNDVQALLQRLNIRSRAQAQAVVDRYIDRKAQEEYRTSETLDDLFED